MKPIEWLKRLVAIEYRPAWHRLEDSEWGLGKSGIPWLLLLVLIGIIARQSLAVAFPSIHHPDEVFQYWEQGYRLFYGAGIVPWEYRDGIRSWIVPGFIAGVIWLVEAMGGSQEMWRFVVQLILSVASMSIVVTAFFWARRLSGLGAGVLAALMASVWFEFLYFSAKPLTAVIAAAVLFPAAYLLCAKPNPSVKACLWGGALLGFAFALRFHVAPMIFVIGLVHLIRTPWKKWWPSLTAAALMVLASGLLDWATWGAPFQSIWLNFFINVFEGKAAVYGTQPLVWYFALYTNEWTGFTIPMLALLLIGARRSPVLFMVPLALVLALSLIGHKEYRFVYPTLPFILTLVSVGVADIFGLATRTLGVSRRRMAFMITCVAIALTSITLLVHDGNRAKFVAQAHHIAAFAKAGEVEGMCGFAVAHLGWGETPGYSGLGRTVPMYLFETIAEADTVNTAFNVIVHRDRPWPKPQLPFKSLGCHDGICVAARPGNCEPSPENEVNALLIGWGQ